MANWKSEARAPIVGIIGGGQLARMMFQAGLSLGIDVHILRSESDESLNKVAKEITVASQFDPTTLYHFARKCDVVTFDHELIPAQLVQELSDRNCKFCINREFGFNYVRNWRLGGTHKVHCLL